MLVVLDRAETATDLALLKPLQELIWQASPQHPLSGVKAD